MKAKEAIVSFLKDLERISKKHDEVTDTDVAESLHLAVNYYFIWGGSRSRMPRTFGMLSKRGDELLQGAFERFLTSVDRSPELSSVPLGQKRLDVLQSTEVREAVPDYEMYLRHRETPLPLKELPEDLFEPGEYD